MTFTYLQFHALFVLPPLLVFSTATAVRSDTAESVVRLLPVVAITAMALGYTIPWDNYLIQHGVWWYGDGRVASVLWHAPVEEYLFILLQPLVATLWLHHVSTVLDRDSPTVEMRWRDRIVGLLAAGVVGISGLLLFARPSTLYLGAIVAWAAPVLAVQWVVGWPYLLARWRLVFAGVAGPAVYFWIADRIAIEYEVWTIASEFTTGVTLAGLPIEEAVFFAVTTLFVVQGLVLYPWVIERWRS